MNEWPSCSNKLMFPANKWPLKSFKWVDGFSKWVTKLFERVGVSSKLVTKSFERMDLFTERMVHAVLNSLQIHRIPFKSGKSLEYVFLCRITFILVTRSVIKVPLVNHISHYEWHHHYVFRYYYAKCKLEYFI